MNTDITIIGAGLAGMTAACALAQTGLDIIVIDSADLEEARKKESDGRTCAIASGSANFFKEIGVWDGLEKHAGKILDIRVTDGDSPIFLHYDHALVGNQPMGYIIENYYLREALFNKANEFAKKGGQHSKTSLHKNGSITILAPAQYTDVQFEDNSCVVSLKNASGDAIKICSRLLIAADGKNSNIRKLAGIRTHEWNYNQSGLVCTIAHTNHHQFTAQERFLPEGPFAVLPMEGGYHSSLVWTEKSELIPLYMSMNENELVEQIRLRTGEYLGKISLASKLFSYPLSLCKAKTYIGKNLLLIGDAAHAMHPLAGQGFNVGIRDVEALVKLINSDGIIKNNNGKKTLTSDNSTIHHLLTKYEQYRMPDSIALIAITDILNRVFSNNILPLRAFRRIGMAAVNKTKPLKKFFMQHAMGEVK